jgi:hypothetical protein
VRNDLHEGMLGAFNVFDDLLAVCQLEVHKGVQTGCLTEG